MGGLSQVLLVLGGLLLVVEVLVRVVAMVVVPRGRRPSAALAWLLAVFFVPIVGALFFLLIGNPKLPRGRRDKQATMDSMIRGVVERSGDIVEPISSPAWILPVVRLNQKLGSMPMMTGNRAAMMTNYAEQVASLTDAVRIAVRTVHVEFYILSHDDTTAPFFTALADAVARGVSVRVLLDHMGSRPYPGYKSAIDALNRAGVAWRLMLPFQPLRGHYQRPDLRNHRKLLVVDGDIAFLGSINMIDRSYDKRRNLARGLQWQDALVRLTGPVVSAVDALFLTDWYSETGELVAPAADRHLQPLPDGTSQCQIVPSGPGFPEENNLKLFNSLMYGAQRRLGVTSPYFVPDESLLQAVTSAAQRGVSVELFVSEIGDQALVFHAQRSYYEDLLRAGVRIWLYPAPFILHAKHVTVDEDVTVIGSSNMDIRSFQLDLEVSLLVCGRDFTDQVRAAEDGYRRLSRELTLTEWQRRSRTSEALDGLARLTSALQ